MQFNSWKNVYVHQNDFMQQAIDASACFGGEVFTISSYSMLFI